jgi:DNA-binding CsgD family transcriptional regulator/tetratricopeptide (TPR) repeat protein
MAQPAQAPLGRLTSPVLVGREHELGVLLEAAERAPALVVVEGEAGVGKSRLANELLAHPELDRHHRLLGRCYQLDEPFPLGPLVEALREASPAAGRLPPVAGALRPLLPELTDRLPPLPEPLGDRRAERHRLFRAVRELLGVLGPTVLVLEDLQWADQSTLELLTFLVPQLPAELVLVCTYRRQDLRDGSRLLGLAARLPGGIGYEHVQVEPLERGPVRELVGAILQTDQVSDEFAHYLCERSGGLPFAVEELLLLLRERQGLVRRSGLWIRRRLELLEVPRAVRDSILERAGQLSHEAQAVLRAAAVVGAPTAEPLLAEVAELPEEAVGAATSEALSGALLVESGQGEYGFRHVLARQSIEEAIPSPELRRLHLRAAKALESAPSKPLARLAHHYRQAGAKEEWIQYAEAAADRAVSMEDDATAFRFLQDALSEPGLAAKTKGRLGVKVATHALYCLEHEEAIAVLRTLLADETLSRGVRGELRLGLGRLLHQAGETAEGYVEVERALPDLARRPALAAHAMAFLAKPWATEGHIDEHLHWLDEARRAAERSGDREVQSAVATTRAVTLLTLGDPQAWEEIERLPRPGDSAEELRRAAIVWNNLSNAAFKIGHYRRDEQFMEEALRLSEQADFALGATVAQVNKLLRDWAVGAWEGLEERARFYLDAREDWVYARADAQTVLGLLLLARGEIPGALRFLEPLSGDFSNMIPIPTWVAAGLARIKLAEGRVDAAVAEASTGLDPIRRKGAWAWAADVAPMAVEALIEADRHADAEEITRAFARGLRGRDAPAASAGLAVCRAHVAAAAGESERAWRAYVLAARAWAQLPRPYEAAQARERAGLRLLVEQDKRGRELVLAASNEFEALGAAWDVARVRRTLREHGAAPPHRRGRKSYGGELSPREREVAELAASGLMNREIAVALFVTAKTVERHLTAAMRKLGATSRADLSERLAAAKPPAAVRR